MKPTVLLVCIVLKRLELTWAFGALHFILLSLCHIGLDVYI
jgi:hypothetical protein